MKRKHRITPIWRKQYLVAALVVAVGSDVVVNHTDSMRRALDSLASLAGAKLDGTDLSHAALYGADLRDVDLRSVNVTGAWYGCGTSWPAGFDPEAHGAKEYRPGSWWDTPVEE